MHIRLKMMLWPMWMMLILLTISCSALNRERPIPGTGKQSPLLSTATTPMNEDHLANPQNQLETTSQLERETDTFSASIGNYVWEDLNSNGLQDDNEPGLKGVSVSLFSIQGNLVQSTTSDEDGQFSFENLSGGEYWLEFNYPNTFFAPQLAGSNPAKDNDADRDGITAVFKLAPGEQRTDLDAGFLYPGHAALCPLTGLPSDANLLDNRPIFISISHFPTWATRPSTGLNSAPVVFETLIDEGQTRLQALFYCGYPEKDQQSQSGEQETSFDIRGVRSGRVFYSELAKLFGAGLIFGGASAEVYKEIAPFQCGVVDNTGIPKNIGDAGLNIESLQAIAENCKHRQGNTELDVWQFGAPPSGGESAPKFLMHYNYLNQPLWEYSQASGGYKRYQNDPATPTDFSLSTDKLTGEAILRQNILVLAVPHQVLNRSGTIIDFDLTDERGYAWLLRDGALHKICWSAVLNDYATTSNRYRPFLLYDCDSKQAINLAIGSTWIHVVDPSFWFERSEEILTAKQPFLGYGP